MSEQKIEVREGPQFPINECKHGQFMFPVICLCCRVEKLEIVCKEQDAEIERLRKVGDRLANAFKNQKLYMQMLICTTDEYIGKELPKVDYEALSEWEKGK